MSRRITNETKITNRACALKTLTELGYDYREAGNSLSILSGPMRGVSLNLQTGVATGDSDHHTKNTLGMLSQKYAEQLLRSEIQAAGGYVESTHTDEKGRVVLLYNIG